LSLVTEWSVAVESGIGASYVIAERQFGPIHLCRWLAGPCRPATSPTFPIPSHRTGRAALSHPALGLSSHQAHEVTTRSMMRPTDAVCTPDIIACSETAACLGCGVYVAAQEIAGVGPPQENSRLSRRSSFYTYRRVQAATQDTGQFEPPEALAQIACYHHLLLRLRSHPQVPRQFWRLSGLVSHRLGERVYGRQQPGSHHVFPEADRYRRCIPFGVLTVPRARLFYFGWIRLMLE
jgi:hypothetical protein